ncbi:hypothetical protein HL658_03250 [Azospirillum sp. RWY-5-1]|uniref:DUF2530 domain-containing protein n=1 Tax=Azospirillum oleiclasticum TaxID=2735135 RepID=A0ABX2T4E4_9PROT|nr:hypothetical protein [Azospirillum oleiclasticum]NYZ11554.1 hypothetical protein [Azospirillum oleiclasticum]NYZ18715.1 hypothetical protein [Azospirillum oleiclasticum]
MAQLHHLRPPPRRRQPFLTCSTLAWLCLLAGGVVAFLALLMPELRGLSTLLGLGVAVGGYLALYDRCRG